MSRLMCRISVDLPEPDSPMMTWIEPAGMSRLMSRRPSTWPDCFSKSALERPFLTGATNDAAFGPNILYRLRILIPPSLMSAMDHLLMLLEPLAICLTDTVEDDRDAHDSK